MDCKGTSIKRRTARGFTLAEFMVAMGAGSLVLLAIASLTFYSSRSMVAMVNYVELNQASRNALDWMTRDIRQVNRLVCAGSVASPTAGYTCQFPDHDTHVEFEDADGKVLSFVYDEDGTLFGKYFADRRPLKNVLLRIKDDSAQLLLTECEELAFGIFQRNPYPGRYEPWPTTNPNICKVVQVNWTCSRTLLGINPNTESVQTAKIVIRKQ